MVFSYPAESRHGHARMSLETARAIDAGLAALKAVQEPGQCFTQQEIADACGVTHQAIALIERRALRKLRFLLRHEDAREWLRETTR